MKFREDAANAGKTEVSEDRLDDIQGGKKRKGLA